MPRIHSRPWFPRWFPPRRVGRRFDWPQRRRSRPQVEPMEDRCVPSTVTNLYGGGAGSLRDAIDNTPAGGTVDFQPGLSGTIDLTYTSWYGSDVLAITKDLTIAGPGADVLAVTAHRHSRVFNIAAGATVVIAGLTIADGLASRDLHTSPEGGGIYNAGTLTLRGCTLAGKAVNDVGLTASANGGGVYNTGTLTITNSTFGGNSVSAGGRAASAYGAGIYNAGTAVVTNSTFGGNAVFAEQNYGVHNAGGGGIFNAGTLTLADDTIAGNSTNGSGGGISNGATRALTIRNTIVAGNTSGDVRGALGSQGYNLIGDGTGGSGFQATDLVGTAAQPIDPLLGALQQNGGPTPTMALLPGSPALDAGDPAQLGQPDQRGVPRAGGVNVGAYQASAATFLVAGFPTLITAGTSGSVTVTARDPYHNAALGYRGTIQFTSSDPQAALPADYTFTAADNGVHTFSATLKTTGMQSVTATDTMTAAVTGTQTGITVVPPASRLALSAFPTPVSAAVSFTITVTAQGAAGDVAAGYTGTVHFSSSDPRAALPAG